MTGLRSIFTLFDGIGPERERQFRARGCRDWQDLLSGRQLSFFPSPLEEQVARAEERYAARDARFFYERLPTKLAYLLCQEFPDQVTLLDIEATGLSRVYHHITLVGWASCGEYSHQLLGRGKTPSPQLLEVLQAAPLTMTFNGNLFDLPFLRSIIDLPPLCPVDLRFLAFRLGYSGSQKVVEETLGISRPAGFRTVRGEDAPALWFRATRGDARALKRLVDYNYLDVRGMAQVYRRLLPRALAADGQRAATSRRTVLPVPTRPGYPIRVVRDDWLPAVADDARPLLRVREAPAVAPVVVGIDLTGSERRGSGLAALTGSEVEVATLHADANILDYVRARNPAVVSIDAPLSLPVGRTVVTDDDPARYTAGIMRWCERELKRRGVNVYPCLLPSMQNLTARGIRLAESLRAEGYPVIESYPGGAQDILSMPRKGVGVEFLRRSLHDVGYRLPIGPLSHDELDAVTSAIVGALFLDGRYEALGTADEDAMIVPCLHRTPPDAELVVAFSGAIGAGKTTASRWLQEQGFSYARYSQVVADEARCRGLGAQREVLQDLGGLLHREWGQRRLGQRLLQRLDQEHRVVIDGLRWRYDAAFLRETFGHRLLHVHMTAARAVRRARYVRDGHSGEDFDRAAEHSVEAESLALAAPADVVIVNEATPDGLYETLRKHGVAQAREPLNLFEET